MLFFCAAAERIFSFIQALQPPPKQEGERLLGRPEREREEAGREGGGGRGGETVNEANQECLLQETHHSLVQRWWLGGGLHVWFCCMELQ